MTWLTLLTWGLRIVGLMSWASKLEARYAADKAEKAVVDEDHRKLEIAAAPDRGPDAILDRMQRGED